MSGLEELLRVEIYRRGLHSDAFGHANLRPSSPACLRNLNRGELVNGKTVSICCFADGLGTTTQTTGRLSQWMSFAQRRQPSPPSRWAGSVIVVPTLQAAFDTASRLPNALLAGELGGDMPAGFDITNSPAQLATRSDVSRPLVLLSSTGTRLMYEIGHSDSAYLACFRNYSATIDYLAKNHDAVTLIGAGTRGEFREEDQMCCAWIADGLMESGFAPEDDMTLQSGRAMARLHLTTHFS